MLILTRKLGESITIGDNIKVTVVDIKGKQVRLGIEAPKNVSVHREEIFLMIKEKNIESAKQTPKSIDEIIKIWEKKKGGIKLV